MLLLTGVLFRAPLNAQTWIHPSIGPPGTATVFMGTNRIRIHANPAERNAPALRFGNSIDPQSKLHLGVLKVAIPVNHEIGQVETPGRAFWQLGRGTSRDGFRISEFSVFEDSVSFQKTLLKTKGQDRMLLFVHGFATGFDEAVLGLAQLAVDLKYDGGLALFSWASRADPLSYIADRDAVSASVEPVERFFRLIGGKNRKLLVVAHSMGAQMVLQAFERLPADVRIEHLVLVAPDVNPLYFIGLQDRLFARCGKITIYVNRHDRALTLSSSRIVNNSALRLGGLGERDRPAALSPRIEIVDISDHRDANMQMSTRHSYFRESRVALNDIYENMMLGIEPRRRFGLAKPAGTVGNYWKVIP